MARQPIQVLEHTGLLEARVLIAHGIGIVPEDIPVLTAAREVGVGSAPKGYLKHGFDTTPVRLLSAAGIPVGLATDGAASNNTIDVWESMTYLALVQKSTESTLADLVGDESVHARSRPHRRDAVGEGDRRVPALLGVPVTGAAVAAARAVAVHGHGPVEVEQHAARDRARELFDRHPPVEQRPGLLGDLLRVRRLEGVRGVEVAGQVFGDRVVGRDVEVGDGVAERDVRLVLGLEVRGLDAEGRSLRREHEVAERGEHQFVVVPQARARRVDVGAQVAHLFGAEGLGVSAERVSLVERCDRGIPFRRHGSDRVGGQQRVSRRDTDDLVGFADREVRLVDDARELGRRGLVIVERVLPVDDPGDDDDGDDDQGDEREPADDEPDEQRAFQVQPCQLMSS